MAMYGLVWRSLCNGRGRETAKKHSASHSHFERWPDMTRRVRLAAAVFLMLAAECGIAQAAEREKTIFTKVTPYATIDVKKGNGGLLTLWFRGSKFPDSAVKVGDPDHIEFEYAQAMGVTLALVDEPKRVLAVGLGGATIPSFLRKHYPGMVIDAVDIDPDVVGVAKKFFGFREDAAMRAYVEDGRQFIEKCEAPYDIIFLDAYGSEDIPYHMATKEFLQAVRRATRPKASWRAPSFGPRRIDCTMTWSALTRKCSARCTLWRRNMVPARSSWRCPLTRRWSAPAWRAAPRNSRRTRSLGSTSAPTSAPAFARRLRRPALLASSWMRTRSRHLQNKNTGSCAESG
jgi:Spermine/spermidine synthase domain